MAKKNTEITPDMPMDVYLMEVIAPSITTIKDDLHELKEKIKSLEEHHSSGLSSSESNDLGESIADKVVSKMQTQQVSQTEQKDDIHNTASILQSAASEGIRKEITPMLQSIGSVNTKVESAISSIESLTKKFDEYVKTNQAVAVSRLQRYIHHVLPAITALAAFLFSWGAYHNSYHYWGERFYKLANDPMQTEQLILEQRSAAFELVKSEFDGGRKKHAIAYIKHSEERLKLHKKTEKKAKRARKKQARKNGGTSHAE